MPTFQYRHSRTNTHIPNHSYLVLQRKWRLTRTSDSSLITLSPHTHAEWKNIVPFPPLLKFLANLFKCSLIPSLILLPIVWYSDAMQCYEYPSNSTDSLYIEHICIQTLFTPLFLFSSLILYMLLLCSSHFIHALLFYS